MHIIVGILTIYIVIYSVTKTSACLAAAAHSHVYRCRLEIDKLAHQLP